MEVVQGNEESQDCFVAICIRIVEVEDPLNFDWRELSADFKGFSIDVDGLLAFGVSGVDGWVPGQVFYSYGFYDFHFLWFMGSDPATVLLINHFINQPLVENLKIKTTSGRQVS